MSTRQLVHRLLAGVPGASFAVRYWDGDEVRYGPGPPEFTLHLRDAAAVRRVLGDPSLGFGEAYMDGAIEVEGDLRDVMRLMFTPAAERLAAAWPARLGRALSGWLRPNSPGRARANAARHYDVGNEFFGLWLGKTMAYSCAYFLSPDDDLDTAQERKFRHLCAKLRLRPGHRLLDVGCGWGGLLVHAAVHHGVQAVGITLSEEQRRGAQERVNALGLADRVTVRLQDYRAVAGAEPFDRIVSVGMFEHVGRRHIPDYFRHTARLLRPGGVGVLHTIGRQAPAPPNPWLTRHIFPGAYFPALGDLAPALAAAGLQVLDVEVLRQHYALTLDRWLEGLEAGAGLVGERYGERFLRMWRLYLASCSASFRHGDFCVFQVQFSHGPTAEVPLTRDYLHR